jgi:hypothetical protein
VKNTAVVSNVMIIRFFRNNLRAVLIDQGPRFPPPHRMHPAPAAMGVQCGWATG